MPESQGTAAALRHVASADGGGTAATIAVICENDERQVNAAADMALTAPGGMPMAARHPPEPRARPVSISTAPVQLLVGRAPASDNAPQLPHSLSAGQARNAVRASSAAPHSASFSDFSSIATHWRLDEKGSLCDVAATANTLAL